MKMISQYKKTVVVLVMLITGILVWQLTAGDLDPPGTPTGTMRTLTEIYAAAFEPVSVPINDGSLYLYVTDIPGDCSDVDHKDWINLCGYTLHVENGADGPKDHGYPKFSNLLIAKETDCASVPLMLRACNNADITEVILERCASTQAGRVSFYRLTLTHPRVTYLAPLSAHTVNREVVSFGGFNTIKWEYRHIDPQTGQPGPWQTEEWDIPNDGGES